MTLRGEGFNEAVSPSPPASLFGMRIRQRRPKTSIAALLADPAQKILKARRLAQGGDGIQPLFELFIAERDVQLLVAGGAEGRSVFRSSAARFGLEVMQRNQFRRHPTLTEHAGPPMHWHLRHAKS